MANHALPTTTSLYTDVLTNLKDRIDDSLKMLDSVNTTPTNVPTNSVRFNSTTFLWEKYNGSAWVSLASSYAIQVSKSINLTGGNSTTLLGAIHYQSNTDTSSILSPNTTTTRKFLRQTGTGTNGAVPVWDTILASDVPTLNQSTTGNAATATKLATARTIGGVSFDGTANIVLPGVNTTGNQSTTGSAATLTTARTINGVSFNGSANINIEDRLGTPIASATTTTIGTAGLGDYIHITGTTTITSFGTASSAGVRRTLIFDGALTITHNATSLICLGAANIVTVSGTVIEVVAETTSNWRVLNISHPSVGMLEIGYLDGVTSDIQTQINGKQATLVSGTNIKTVNSTSLLGSGNIAVQPTLVSGTNIKTIGGVSILGSGDINFNSYISLPIKVAYNQISVDGTTLTLTNPTAGTDYYFSKTAITTSIQSDTIGGFHYGLTPPGETPTGNKTSADITAIAGINAYSIWTNWHRPNCGPRGMIKVGDIWVDIYLADSRYGIRKYSAPTSITSYKIAGGGTDYGREIPLIPTEFGGDGSSNYGKLTWFQVNEIAKAAGKRSLRCSEFPSAMYGVLEQTGSISYDGGGGNIFHIAQLTSKFGIEQATGTQWVWGDDVQGIGGDGWKTGLTDSRGSIYAYTNQPTAVLLGGRRDSGSNVGSRCSLWNSYVWLSDWHIGCRFACDHLKLV